MLEGAQADTMHLLSSSVSAHNFT